MHVLLRHPYLLGARALAANGAGQVLLVSTTTRRTVSIQTGTPAIEGWGSAEVTGYPVAAVYEAAGARYWVTLVQRTVVLSSQSRSYFSMNVVAVTAGATHAQVAFLRTPVAGDGTIVITPGNSRLVFVVGAGGVQVAVTGTPALAGTTHSVLPRIAALVALSSGDDVVALDGLGRGATLRVEAVGGVQTARVLALWSAPGTTGAMHASVSGTTLRVLTPRGLATYALTDPAAPALSSQVLHADGLDPVLLGPSGVLLDRRFTPTGLLGAVGQYLPPTGYLRAASADIIAHGAHAAVSIVKA